MGILEIIVSAIAGGVASIIAPWAHWRIEIIRDKRNAQRKLLNDVRDQLHMRPSNEDFSATLAYSRIKPYLSDTTIKVVEGGKNNSIEFLLSPNGGGVSLSRATQLGNYGHLVLDELALLEKEWKLI